MCGPTTYRLLCQQQNQIEATCSGEVQIHASKLINGWFLICTGLTTFWTIVNDGNLQYPFSLLKYNSETAVKIRLPKQMCRFLDVQHVELMTFANNRYVHRYVNR